MVYLNEQIGDKPLASIDNPEARTLIAKMVSERTKDGKRRFSDIINDAGIVEIERRERRFARFFKPFADRCLECGRRIHFQRRVS